MKKLILGILCVLVMSEVSMAKEKYIQLKDDTYQMENICFNPKKISDKDKLFWRYYKFTFNSKYNVFENYSDAGTAISPIDIKTNVYTISSSNPSLIFYFALNPIAVNKLKILKNKKTIEIVLSADDMKKLYESNSAKVVFHNSIFTSEYTRDKYTSYSFTPLTPVISISLNKRDFKDELKKCTEKENKYKKEHDEYHSKPMNRIKTFFNF